MNQQMGHLPTTRITLSFPFEHVILDYAGPIRVLTAPSCGHKSHKAFICVFICLSTKAVNLELVLSYNTKHLLLAFNRFSSRRGLYAHIHSDCSLNFADADAEMRRLFDSASEFSSTVVHNLA